MKWIKAHILVIIMCAAFIGIIFCVNVFVHGCVKLVENRTEVYKAIKKEAQVIDKIMKEE